MSIVFFGFLFEREFPSWFGLLCCAAVVAGCVLLSLDRDPASLLQGTPSAIAINLASVVASGLQVALMRRAWRKIADAVTLQALSPTDVSRSALSAAMAPHRSSSALALVNGVEGFESPRGSMVSGIDGAAGVGGDDNDDLEVRTRSRAVNDDIVDEIDDERGARNANVALLSGRRVQSLDDAEAELLAQHRTLRQQTRWRAALLLPVATWKLFVATLLLVGAALALEFAAVDALLHASWPSLVFIFSGVRMMTTTTTTE